MKYPYNYADVSAQKGNLFSLCCTMGDTGNILIFDKLGVDSNCCSERTYFSKSIKILIVPSYRFQSYKVIKIFGKP